MKELQDLLRRLALAEGVSGAEGTAADVAAQELARFMPVRRDALGSVIGEKAGTGKHFLLDAHIDQIGMIVTGITKEGFLRVAPVGGMDVRILPAAEVMVWGKEPLFGVVTSTPPHLSKADERGKAKGFDKLAIDIGYSETEAKQRVSPGDRVTLKARFAPLLGSRVCGGSLDDRAGVAVLLHAVALLDKAGFDGRLSVLFSVQEEVGGSGAAAGGFALAADAAIAVDGSFAAAPGNPAEKCGALGKGPMIGFSPTLDYTMSKTLCALAEREEIPYQREIMGGKTSTNADELQIAGSGIPMALVSVPMRNMHTAVELLDLADIENSARLIAAYIREDGAAL